MDKELFHREIDNIVNDKSHGSIFIARAITKVIMKSRFLSDPLPEIRSSIQKLRTINPSMVVVHHLVRFLELHVDTRLFYHLEVYDHFWIQASAKVADKFNQQVDLEGKTILVHSHSGTVIKSLELAKGTKRSFKTIQTESLPGGEGTIQAESLNSLKISTDICKDGEVSQKAKNVDLAVLGVDQYSIEHREFVNKVGSHDIVNALTSLDKPIYVLGDSRKKVDTVIFGGKLFERVPFSPMVRFISENGPLLVPV